ncbi:hypothetical protein VTL71DRAFT_233 [Oculimacula yallundae]|uniref:Uncharacterized protein n=1 Tax=Oculimacula yallundae TaxID=86028 RepID=A0ABR4CZJ6_9HELO
MCNSPVISIVIIRINQRRHFQATSLKPEYLILDTYLNEIGAFKLPCLRMHCKSKFSEKTTPGVVGAVKFRVVVVKYGECRESTLSIRQFGLRSVWGAEVLGEAC